MNYKALFKLILSLYLFIFSIELLKNAALILGKNLINVISIIDNPLNALGTGWFLASIFQSSGTITTLTATLTGIGILALSTAIFIVMGANIGTTITSTIVSFFMKTKKRRDFRHGFEIALANGIYRILFITLFFIIEILFHPLEKFGYFISSNIKETLLVKYTPNLIDFLVGPLINLFTKYNPYLNLILAFFILFFILNLLTRSILEVLGGEKNARKIISKYFKTPTRSLLIGILLTAILFSSSITISLLVPLTVLRLLNLKKAIPFILGANIGTGTDTLLAALIIAKPLAIALALIYILIDVIGVLIFLPNTNLIFKITKFISKRVLHVSRKKVLLFLIAFILIPIILILL